MNARDLLATLLDPGTFRSWDDGLDGVRTGPSYAGDLARAREKTGLDESVITGTGLIGGRRVAVAASEFAFLGGSIGVAAGERLTRAVERATAERLPMITLPASGGTRMQEGTVAFLQMVKITAAVTLHKAAHLPYVAYLRHPTTGGVFASWASLGHLTLAEPGALIGFLGPRVYEGLLGVPFPDGVQTAENLRAHGLVDAIVAPGELAAFLDRVLTALAPAPGEGAARAGATGPGGAAPPDQGAALDRAAPRPESSTVTGRPAWESVLRTREAGWPGTADLIQAVATDVVPLQTVPLPQAGMILTLARIGGYPCVVIGQDRQQPPPGPAALRLARRGIRLAAELRLPLVTVIDTPGAELSPQAEEGGLAREIAFCLADLLTHRGPVVSVLLGRGAGGAALALLPADRTLAAEHAWLAPLAPEGASAIVYRDSSHAAELAARQGIRATDLAALGIVDRVIPEPAGNAPAWDPGNALPGDSGGAMLRDLGDALRRELADLTAQDDEARRAARARRYRHLGVAL
jgi:acyl-CoA carboxylase subunit beta